MTGFGKSELSDSSGRFGAEIAGVNNRFVEVSIRLPRKLSSFEPKIRDMVLSCISRGKISVYISFELSDKSPDKYLINRAAAKAYHSQLLKLKKELKIGGSIEIADILSLPDLVNPEANKLDERALWPSLSKTVDKALGQMLLMRHKEGEVMKKDMGQRIKIFSGQLKDVVRMAVDLQDHYRQRLKRRISEILDQPVPDSARLEEEIAIYAEKSDISEECIRLESHLKQYRSNLKVKGPVGKKLNFLLQEMNREVNTIASKSAGVDLSATVISMKDELEKMREMVQNVE